MGSNDLGQRALARLDEVLRKKPHADGHAFSAATEALAQLRDAIIEQQRGRAPDRQRLEHVNAVISVVLAGHFPLGSIPWHEIELARNWLVSVVGE